MPTDPAPSTPSAAPVHPVAAEAAADPCGCCCDAELALVRELVAEAAYLALRVGELEDTLRARKRLAEKYQAGI